MATTGNPLLFDRSLIARRRARAGAGFADFSFIQARIAEEIGERLSLVQRRFSSVLDIGPGAGTVPPDHPTLTDDATLFRGDLTPTIIQVAPHQLALDEEYLPFAGDSLDLIVSALSLHWVNDLPGALLQMRRALKPDGLFIGALIGGESLNELRTALAEAEIERDGGLSPRVSPFGDQSELAGLLQRAGFALPVVDADRFTVRYAHPLRLLQDLRGMGETNALLERRKTPLTRGTLLRAMEIYQERFADPDGKVPASFEVIFLTGWAPHESQQKPLKPGSAAQRLADALATEEVSTGVKPGES